MFLVIWNYDLWLIAHSSHQSTITSLSSTLFAQSVDESHNRFVYRTVIFNVQDGQLIELQSLCNTAIIAEMEHIIRSQIATYGSYDVLQSAHQFFINDKLIGSWGSFSSALYHSNMWHKHIVKFIMWVQLIYIVNKFL